MRFAVHVHPGSKAPSVGGSYAGALSVHVRARTVDGAATAEVLAAAFGVHASQVGLVRGAASRDKTLSIEGHDVALAARLEQLLGSEADRRG
jgi:uncharacterized protein YggU (UPF0235/DUF167 family)